MARRAADLETGAMSTTRSSCNSASTPPAPTTTSGPNAGSRVTPTSSSREVTCWAWTTTPRSPSPKRRSKSRYVSAAAVGSPMPSRTAPTSDL